MQATSLADTGTLRYPRFLPTTLSGSASPHAMAAARLQAGPIPPPIVLYRRRFSDIRYYQSGGSAAVAPASAPLHCGRYLRHAARYSVITLAGETFCDIWGWWAGRYSSGVLVFNVGICSIRYSSRTRSLFLGPAGSSSSSRSMFFGSCRILILLTPIFRYPTSGYPAARLRRAPPWSGP